MKIVLTGGGSGGHIIPLAAIAQEIKHIDPAIKVHFIGAPSEFEQPLLDLGVRITHIKAGKFRRYFTIQSILLNILDFIFTIPWSFVQAFFMAMSLKGECKCVFSKGGYGALPISLMARLWGIPVILHESDSIAGETNKLIGKYANKIFTAFPDTLGLENSKISVVGNPVRQELLNGNREEAQRVFNILSQRPVVLVLGGSQGSQRVNDMILTVLPQLLLEFELIHQCGKNNYTQVAKEANLMLNENNASFYHLSPFFDGELLKNAFAIADIVVSRAGAGAIFEIASLGKPSILIPLPESAQNHQVRNAYIYSKSGAGEFLEEQNFSPNILIEHIKTITENPRLCQRMSENALRFSKPNSAKDIAQQLVDFARM